MTLKCVYQATHVQDTMFLILVVVKDVTIKKGPVISYRSFV